MDRVRRDAYGRRGEPSPGVTAGLVVVLGVYTVLTVTTVYVLRRLARARERVAAPQERGYEPGEL